MSWLREASKCGSRAEAIAILLWHLAGLNGSAQVKLTPNVLSILNVSTKTRDRTLPKMQSRGLVSVDRQRGRCPIVTLLDHPGSPAPETSDAPAEVQHG